jgi:hypothetical protein
MGLTLFINSSFVVLGTSPFAWAAEHANER